MNHLATTAYIAVYVTVLDRYRELRRNGAERGLTTTEVAMLTFILVGIAAAAGVLLWNYSKGQIEDVDNVDPPVFD